MITVYEFTQYHNGAMMPEHLARTFEQRRVFFSTLEAAVQYINSQRRRLPTFQEVSFTEIFKTVKFKEWAEQYDSDNGTLYQSLKPHRVYDENDILKPTFPT